MKNVDDTHINACISVPEEPVKYLHLLTDKVFFPLFATEEHKFVVMHFVNDVLNGRRKAVDVLQNTDAISDIERSEMEGLIKLDCIDAFGDEFIVLIQRIRCMHNIIDNAQYLCMKIMYENPPVAKSRGKKSCFEHKEIFFIGLMEHTNPAFNSDSSIHAFEIPQMVFIKFRNPKKFNFYFLEFPKFMKEQGIQKGVEEWMYLFKNLPTLKSAPDFLKSGVFKTIFKVADRNNQFCFDQKDYNKQINAINDFDAEYYDSYLNKQGVNNPGLRKKGKKVRIIENLLDANKHSIQEIAEICEESEAEVLKIQKYNY